MITKIAILSINIGDYSVFWDGFYESAEKNLFPEAEKSYFVFTDNEELLNLKKNNISFIKKNDLGWPFNTMKRFNMFSSIVDELREFDYVFFANANALFEDKLSINLIHNSKNYIVVEHPGFHFAKDIDKPFERRVESKAYVEESNGHYYVQGAFYGAKAKYFINLALSLNRLTEIDLENGIVALWHDESFLNMFVSNNIEQTQVLGWQYLYFEEYVLPYNKMIVLRNKKKYLADSNGRYKGQNFKVQYAKVIMRNLKWKFLINIGKIPYEKNYFNGQYYGADITRE